MSHFSRAFFARDTPVVARELLGQRLVRVLDGVRLSGNREWLDLLWNWVQALPSVAEIIGWVLFLPIMVGLWIWESSWPDLVRLLAFAGIAVWTLLAVSSFLRAVR